MEKARKISDFELQVYFLGWGGVLNTSGPINPGGPGDPTGPKSPCRDVKGDIYSHITNGVGKPLQWLIDVWCRILYETLGD